MDPEFPMHLWDKTIPQAELTLNLLRQSRINPKMSAWEQIHGWFDFNRTPFPPHARPTQRQTWAPHTFDAWYIGPAMEHYRCYTVWAIQTRQTRVVIQLMWFPKQNFPRLTNIDLLRATIEDAITILRNPPQETFVGMLETTQRACLIDLFNTLHPQEGTNQKHTGKDDTLPQPQDDTPLGVPRVELRQSAQISHGNHNIMVKNIYTNRGATHQCSSHQPRHGTCSRIPGINQIHGGTSMATSHEQRNRPSLPRVPMHPGPGTLGTRH